jgi:hypothetical protein
MKRGNQGFRKPFFVGHTLRPNGATPCPNAKASGAVRGIDNRLATWANGAMSMLEDLIPVARGHAADLKPGLYLFPDLPTLWVDGRPAPKNIAGAAWRAAGFTRYKSNKRRGWIRPDVLPPVVTPASCKQPGHRAKRRYTVDLSPLRMQPGDGVAVHITPDAITIRKATPGIEVK